MPGVAARRDDRQVDALGFDLGHRPPHEGGADTRALVSGIDGDHVDLAGPGGGSWPPRAPRELRPTLGPTATPRPGVLS